MKANWKIALMCFAAVAMVACKSTEPDDPKKEGGEEEEGEFVSPIKVDDNSLADWDALPAEYVVSATCPDDAALLGLKSVKVYADKLYINIIAEYSTDDIIDLEWVPFHVYLNADNSDATGGYGDEFTDANAEWLLEGAVLAEGAAYSYNPAVFKWWGEVGGAGWEWTDPDATHDASDFWGAIVGEGQLPVGASQIVDGNKIEIQILRELIPAEWADEFGIGFDIQQNWSSVGVLPLVSPTEANANGYTKKLQVKIDK
mgnify:CR=1 FL=1